LLMATWFTNWVRRCGVSYYNIASPTRSGQGTTFYSEPISPWRRFQLMSTKARELGTATLGGVVVGSVLATIFGIANLPLYSAIGTFIGGAVSAYLLRGKLGQATIAGALSGILGTPTLLGLSDIVAILSPSLIPTPPGPPPSPADLQAAVILIVGMDLLAGAVGGAMVGSFYRPQKAPMQIPPPPTGAGPMTPTPTAQMRYCVQCGAQLPTGAVICPHCNARQPQ
jgi:hypothetical protein